MAVHMLRAHITGTDESPPPRPPAQGIRRVGTSLPTSSETYTSVLPQVARDAAEKTAAQVPGARARTLGLASGPHQTTVDSRHTGERSSETMKDQVNTGVDLVPESAPPGTRTPNPRIKRPKFTQSQYDYLRLYEAS